MIRGQIIRFRIKSYKPFKYFPKSKTSKYNLQKLVDLKIEKVVL